ncbi:MAG: hypothetical protein HC836_12720 [Richelia sp. RM2_1_2]|nr:hypothetical protein [Richelia sp. RM2_1_2]
MKVDVPTLPYRTSFSSYAKCLIDDEKNIILSQASLEQLSNIIPKESFSEGKEDLLPFASNVCTVNVANKNHDSIRTKTALKIRDAFIHKPVNQEHNREKIIGHFISAAFSEYDPEYRIGKGSKILLEEEIKETSKPFNIALSGFVYKIIDQEFAEKLIEANNPTSPSYLSISLSWEIAFNNYKLMLDSMFVEEAEIIDDPQIIEKYNEYLLSNGGKGVLPNGRKIYRLIEEEKPGDIILPLGAGFTISPAGNVQGVFVHQEEIFSEKEENKSSFEKNNSQKININVRNSKSMKKIKIKTFDDVQKLLDSSDAAVQVGGVDYDPADIQEILLSKIEEMNSIYKKELEAKENTAKEAVEMKENLEKEMQHLKETNEASMQTLNESLKKIKEELEKVKLEKEEFEKNQAFNERMTNLDEEFDLDDEVRADIASKIHGLSDQEYTDWYNSFSKYAKKMKKVVNEMTASENLEVKSINTEGEDTDDPLLDAFRKLKKLSQIFLTLLSPMKRGLINLNKHSIKKI